MSTRAQPTEDLAAVAEELKALLRDALPRLERIDGERALRPLRGGGWSAQQELGHMIDSAIVNQQRLVRVRLESEPLVTPYDQNGWVAAQRMERRAWGDVVALWAALNRHVAHLIEATPPGDALRPARLEDGSAVTFGFLARDYVAHQRHHLEAILGAS